MRLWPWKRCLDLNLCFSDAAVSHVERKDKLSRPSIGGVLRDVLYQLLTQIFDRRHGISLNWIP